LGGPKPARKRPHGNINRWLHWLDCMNLGAANNRGRNPRGRQVLALAGAFLAVMLLARPLWACTLWAAAGERVAGGGTLLVKNRDWRPDHRQELKLVHPTEGFYAYYCLYADGPDRGVKAGINQKGLVVVSATAPFSQAQREAMYRTPALNAKLLANCADVSQALNSTGWFWGPRFLLLADAFEIALLAIGPEGNYQITRTKSGVLYHTNHYVQPALVQFNPDKKLTSSRARFERISRLLAGDEKFTLAEFAEMAASRQGGPDNALWRTGKKPSFTRTLSTWIVQHKPAQGAELYVKIANPGEEVKEYHLRAPEIFTPQ